MNDWLIKVYSSIRNKSSLLTKVKYYGFLRFLIRFLANHLVPLNFSISNMKNKESNRLREIRNDKLIVSLTTFPDRINKVWIVVECMLRQTYKPDRIILWLSEEQFSDTNKLPKKLLNQQKRGLEIMICKEDIRSHKKYYYALRKFPNSNIITVDDDLLYPSNLIAQLINWSSKFPNTICCHRALKIKVLERDVLPYINWDFIYGSYGPSNNLFFTSGGGTLFPPNSLHNEVLNKDVFMNHCKFADDVWLNAMCQLQNTQIVKVFSKHAMHIPIFIENNFTLSSVNIGESLNDVQIRNVRAYYKLNLNIDYFSNILSCNHQNKK